MYECMCLTLKLSCFFLYSVIKYILAYSVTKPFFCSYLYYDSHKLMFFILINVWFKKKLCLFNTILYLNFYIHGVYTIHTLTYILLHTYIINTWFVIFVKVVVIVIHVCCLYKYYHIV